jgi:hypothetical protein
LDKGGATGFFKLVDINPSVVFYDPFVVLFDRWGFQHHISG